VVAGASGAFFESRRFVVSFVIDSMSAWTGTALFAFDRTEKQIKHLEKGICSRWWDTVKDPVVV